MAELSPEEFQEKLGNIALRCGGIYLELFRCLPGRPITKPKLSDVSLTFSVLNEIRKITEHLEAKLKDYMKEQPEYYKSKPEHID